MTYRLLTKYPKDYLPTIKAKLKWFLCGVGISVWIYGTCHDREARKHKLKGNVQFVLWKKGEHGYKNAFWHNFEHSWWVQFVKH